MMRYDDGATKSTFLRAIRAEEYPRTFTWHGRDWIALAAIPTVFLLAWSTSALTNDLAVQVISDTTLRIVLFSVLVIANRELLARHWRAFARVKWRATGLVILGFMALQVVTTILGTLLRSLGHSASDITPAQPEPAETVSFLVLLFASCSPVVTALIEDFTFRHTLLLKFPVWHRRFLAVSLVVGNALVFGAIHVNNFGGDWLLTLSFAGAGLLMNLIYLWIRNIWVVLLMHGVNNFVLGGPLAVVIVHLLGAQ
ncbi:hypothetical protein PlfCFBP13513_14890 [Plantibacter flavus]|uniref:CPBP family intramembrane glutamic endopeptidase n=1 Tax=Plantibacter TaxID=190323 RepID=UPI0010C181BF|nr:MULTISPECIES: type II CAAX endopeptidase family protein [Plantibacter]MBD8103780.1 CPBP family intramembrane metalloprotease [Plantibacter sp. CFBP 8775]MBD8467229.1 CPBP family intramembrane metalloprotease [Plantibacter sp. CFBP 8798]TKJ96710.1 hypothetical protein PlfCFBP13513_14890 [Plantibacter flavus]